MSTFDDLIAASVAPQLMAAFGVSATYTAPGGAPVTLTAALESDRVEADESDEEGRRRNRVVELSITNDPASTYGGVASPVVHATVDYAGESFMVQSIPKYGTLHRLVCVRAVRAEASRPNYRR